MVKVNTNDRYAKRYQELRAPTPLTRSLRQAAYGEDIGQHSWTTKDELDRFIHLLNLNASSKVLDVGCGAGGPSRYITEQTGCQVLGIDISEEGILAANQFAGEKNLLDRVSYRLLDAADNLKDISERFHAVIAIDALIHLKDRLVFFLAVKEVLHPHGHLLFTDAGVITGIVSNEEITCRSMNGFTQFCPAGFNEKLLAHAGFQVSHSENANSNIMQVVQGRLHSREQYQSQLEKIEGEQGFARDQEYLRLTFKLAEEERLSRYFYLAET